MMTLLTSGHLGRAVLVTQDACYLYDVDGVGRRRVVPRSTASQIVILDPLVRVDEYDVQPTDTQVETHLLFEWNRLQSPRLVEIALQEGCDTQIRRRAAQMANDLLSDPRIAETLQSSLIAKPPSNSWNYPQGIPKEVDQQLRMLHLLNWAGRACRNELEALWTRANSLSKEKTLMRDLLAESGIFHAVVQAIAHDDDKLYSAWLTRAGAKYPELRRHPLNELLQGLWQNLWGKRGSISVSSELLSLIPSPLTVHDLGLLEGTLPQLTSVLIVAHHVEAPSDELRKAVERNFRRSVKYAFLISNSTAAAEEHQYYEIFCTLERIALRKQHETHLGPPGCLTELHRLSYDWRDKPIIFYTFLLEDRGSMTIGLQGDQQKEGIADNYNLLPSDRAQAIYDAVTRGAPERLTIRPERFLTRERDIPAAVPTERPN